jgi:acetyl-CoA acyltransferase
MSSAGVVIAGVGMTRFRRPSEGARYEDLAHEAALSALTDAGLDFAQVDQVFTGWAYGDTTSGQRALAEMNTAGVPFFNVNNACASGSSAAFLARQAILGGAAECVLVVGFEQMPAGALDVFFADRTNVFGRHSEIADQFLAAEGGPFAPRLFAAAAHEHMARDGIGLEAYAKIAVKARRHAHHNPNAVFTAPLTVENVLASPAVVDPLTRLHCCPPTSGAAAAVFCSQVFARRRGLNGVVVLSAMALVSDQLAARDGPIAAVGSKIATAAAVRAYEESGVSPGDIDVVELHDCFTVNEALAYEDLGLAPAGGAERMIIDDDNTYGGQIVVNPSGGLLAKGHPLGATGVAQLAELTWQLRGQAGERQVEGARIGVQHNVGLNGAAVVSVLMKD